MLSRGWGTSRTQKIKGRIIGGTRKGQVSCTTVGTLPSHTKTPYGVGVLPLSSHLCLKCISTPS